MPSISSAVAAVDVLEPEDRRLERNVNQVVAVLRRHARDVGLHGQLRPAHADDLEPLLVHLDVLADGIVGAEERRGGAFAQHGDGRRRLGLGVGEEAAVDELQVGDALIGRADAVDDRRVALRARQELRRREPLARRRRRDVVEVRLDHAIVPEGQARRELPHLLHDLIVGRLARLDDQVAHAELLDERHDFLLRAGADREHRDDRRHAEDHPHHREERSQLVRAQVLEPEPQLGQEVRRRARDAGRGHG